MKYMATYDWMESIRNTSEWAGASARALASYPAFALSMNPMIALTAAWGEVAERSFGRMGTRPGWGIRSIVGPTGQDHLVDVTTVVEKAFGNLVHFAVRRREPMARKLLVVAPMSGHYATLLRSTVTSLLPDAEVYVTDWHNARDIPVSEGKFDIEDYTLYLVEFMRHLGPDTHVIAVCQPAPLTLAATAYLAAEDPDAQPRTLTLIGGPIDPDAAATDVTDFGRRVTMGQLEQSAIQRVGFKYKGAGRLVYPGLMQLAGFISMNAERHSKAFREQVMHVVRGEASDHDAHNRFYDEYLSVMDMTAEFYLSTVERIFKNREIARNEFVVGGKRVDLAAIKRVAVMTVEGEKDDISAPGQCVAALDMLPGLPDSKKAKHLEPDAGHYGIFAGKSWRLNIRPLVLGFIDKHSALAKDTAEPVAASKVQPVAERLAEPAKIKTLQKPTGVAARAVVRTKPKAEAKVAPAAAPLAVVTDLAVVKDKAPQTPAAVAKAPVFVTPTVAAVVKAPVAAAPAPVAMAKSAQPQSVAAVLQAPVAPTVVVTAPQPLAAVAALQESKLVMPVAVVQESKPQPVAAMVPAPLPKAPLSVVQAPQTPAPVTAAKDVPLETPKTVEQIAEPVVAQLRQPKKP